MGREAGFSTVEAFAEKVRRQESDGADRVLSRHEVESDRVRVRAFRDTGDPLGLSLSAPDSRQVKAGLAGLASSPVLDRRKNFAHLLPHGAQKVKVSIYDPGIELWDEAQAADLRERLRECLVTFPGLQLIKFQFMRALKKVYLANSLGFFAKYKKTLFQVQASFMLKDHALELSESRTFFRDFDPQRLVARGANLLGALAADPEPAVITNEYVVMSPEASALVLKEFSPGLKRERSAPRGHGTAASARVSIIDHGAMDGQPGSAPFDDEGTAAGEKYLVNKGVALAAIADIRTAFAAGGKTTGNGFRDERGVFPQAQFSNLFIRPANDSLAQLLQQARQGVLIYLVKPKGAGRQPGELLFSAYGYFFASDGIARPVHFHFATTMRSYLLHVLAVSRELRFFHSRANIGSPYLLLQGRPGPGKVFLI
ncbi:MAG: metallopeptidase TldD-related protein [Acidobacteria bacterium]|jgi:predicted Zn-dependent protease|nr:metallopeptidase TldD-related protein [Acidobacteriota bacterium]